MFGMIFVLFFSFGFPVAAQEVFSGCGRQVVSAH